MYYWFVNTFVLMFGRFGHGQAVLSLHPLGIYGMMVLLGGYIMAICCLSGMEIPPGKNSKEHIYPRMYGPQWLVTQPYNIAPAIKIFNQMKAARCMKQWEAQKYHLCTIALKWNIRNDDKALIRRALDGEMIDRDNPCEICPANIHKQYCLDFCRDGR